MNIDLAKYHRQIKLKSFGLDKQNKLTQSEVLIVGCGGLGVPVAQYLNAMGVGTIGLLDNDTIASHNLHRQVLFDEGDVGQKKVVVAAKKLRLQNSQTKIEPITEFLSITNALKHITAYDVVVDATDNFSTRYLINDACVILKKPFVYGALHDFEGQVSVFNFKGGPTYRCLFPNMPEPHEIPNCDENGVLGVLPGIIGTLQALEAVKVLTEIGEVLSGKLLIFDGLSQQNRLVQFKADPKNSALMALRKSYGALPCEVVKIITAADFMRDKRNKQIIDVRSSKEFNNNCLDDAKNIPLDTLKNRLSEIDFSMSIFLICQSGQRSRRAYEILKNVRPDASLYQIEGGMNEIVMPCQ